MALAKATIDHIQDLAARYPSRQSAIIPALWAAQHEQGYVTDDAMQEIARQLGLPASLIEATASFYSMFLRKPEGRHDMVVCVNAPCMLRGADDVVVYLERALGVRDGKTTPDGAISWHSTIECLGGCGGAPMMQVDHYFEENLTPERIDAIIDRLRRGVAPGEGPPAGATEPLRRKSAATPQPSPTAAETPKRKPAAPRRKKSET